MITEKELLQAIRECEADPVTPNKASKLADFYIIYDHLFGDPVDTEYSYKAPADEKIKVSGESEFFKKINGKDSEKVWSVIDELVSVIQVINPRLYEGVLRKLDE